MRVSSIGFLNVTTTSISLIPREDLFVKPPQEYDYVNFDLPSGKGGDGSCEVFWTLGEIVEGEGGGAK